MFNFKASPLVLEYTYGSSGMIEFYATPPVIYKPQPNEQSLPNIEKTEVSVNGQLNRSVMQAIKTEARGKHDLQGEWLEYKRTLATTEHKALIKHGIFRVVEQEYSVDEDKTSFTMYDLMVRTHKEVHKDEFTLSFPTTLLGLFKEVARICELETDVTSFRNSDVVVARDEWTNTENTYRDILDHIAGIVGMTIGIRDNKLDIWQPQETGITLNENRAKDLRVGEKVGKFNILNITQEPQHYNTPYPPNWQEIPMDDRVEYVLENNPIVEQDREKFAPIIFNNIKDLEYYEFETDTYGWGIFDIGDIVTVKDLEGNEYKSIVTGEYGEFNGAFTSKVVSERLDNAKDEYVVASDQRREGQRVYLIVDQQEGKIQGLLEKTDDQEDRITDLTLDLEGIKTEVSSISTQQSVIPNLNGTAEGYQGWEWRNSTLYNHPRLVQRDNLRANTNFLITELPNSLSRFGLEFYSNGSALSPIGYIVPNTTYSFRGRRIKGSQPYRIIVHEYKGDTLNKSTPFDMSGTQAYGAFTMTPKAETDSARLEFVISGVSHGNPLILSEMMFNRGNPTEYRDNANDVKLYAKSQITQLDNEIKSTVEEVKVVDGKVEKNSSVISQQANQITSMVGDIETQGSLITQNKNEIDLKVSKDGIIGGINASPETVKIHSSNLDFNNATGNNVNLTGKITATSGKVGGYTIQDDKLVGNDVTLGTREIGIGNTSFSKSATDSTYLDISMGGLNFISKTGNTIFQVDGRQFFMNTPNNTTMMVSTIVPNGSAKMIGSDNARFNNIYLNNQPNVASDHRRKSEVIDIPDKLVEMFMTLEPKQYVQNGQIHFGYIAQDVERIIFKYLSSTNKYNSVRELNEDAKRYAILYKDETFLSLLYGEITILKDAYYKRKIEQLECDIIELKKKPRVSKGFRKRSGR